MNGKGRGPMKGYNHQKYAENYDQIFRTMKTNQEESTMTTTQPAPVLAWHTEAAKVIHETPYDIEAIRRGDSGEGTTAAIIAAHDPHAETVRLLEGVVHSVEQLHDSPKSLLFNLNIALPAIRTHLAKLKGTQ